MATEYDLAALSSDVSSYVESVKDDFLDSLDSAFLERVMRMVDTSNNLGHYRNAIDITINSLDDVENILQEAIANITSFTIPPKPDSLTEGIDRDVDHVFISDQLDDLSSHFEAIYTSPVGNSGYTYDSAPDDNIDAISTALFSNGYELDSDSLEKDIDEIASQWASDGYELAPGALSYSVAKAINEFDKARQSKVQTPTSMLATAIQDNIQSAFENGISIEKLHIGFAKRYTQFKYDKLEAEIKAYIGEIDKIQMEIEAPVLSIKSILKAAQVDNDLDIEEMKLTLDAELNHLKNWVSAVLSRASTNIDLLTKQAAILEHTTQGFIGLFSTYGSMFTGVNIQEQAVKEEGA